MSESSGPLPEDRPIVVIVQTREVEEVRVFARDGLVDAGIQLPPCEETVAVGGLLPGELAGEGERGRFAVKDLRRDAGRDRKHSLSG